MPKWVMPKWVVAVGGVMSAILVTVAGAIAYQWISGDEKTVPRPVAQEFFEEYWRNIIADKAAAWPHLSDDYKTKRKMTFDKYGTDFARFKAIEVRGVHVTDERNTFAVELMFVSRSGRRSGPETIRYHVGCGRWKGAAPVGLHCSADDLVIEDGDR